MAAVGAGDDDVVARALGLVGDLVDGAGDRGDDRRALGGGDVLALVDVAGAAGAEARVLAAEVNGPWTGKIFEPVVASEAGAAAPARVGATTSAARAGSASTPAPLTHEPRGVLARGATAAVQVAAQRSAARRRGRAARAPRACRGRSGRPARARRAWRGSANVTVAPGATVAGVAVKPRAVGPASVPPLPAAEAGAGKASRARGRAERRITPLMSAARELL